MWFIIYSEFSGAVLSYSEVSGISGNIYNTVAALVSGSYSVTIAGYL